MSTAIWYYFIVDFEHAYKLKMRAAIDIRFKILQDRNNAVIFGQAFSLLKLIAGSLKGRLDIAIQP
jgi:ABC-type uncharacterized transport system auxiliary subunit